MNRPAPIIPEGVIGMMRRLTTSEISMYMIDCGPGGIHSGREMFYTSGDPRLAAYVFQMPSCIYDADGLYTLTIHKADNLPALSDPGNPNGGTRTRRRRGKGRKY